MIKTLFSFLSQVFEEFKKIHWPDKSDFIFSVIGSLGVVIFFSLFLALTDGLISSAVKIIIMRFT